MTEPDSRFGGRIPLRGRSLRVVTAQGTIVNGIYQVLLITVGMLRGVVVAAFLTAEEYGVWGLLFITLTTLMFLKQFGVGDKFVQQGEEDQEAAFQKAFTFELISTAGFMVLIAVCLPLLALMYGQSEIVLPGLLMSLGLLISSFQSPLWIYFRRMDFVPQRVIQALDPVVGFVVTVALAVAGAGYWSLVAGVLAGAIAASSAAVIMSPYKLGLRFERRSVREYFAFSWPLVVAGGSTLVIAQGSIIATEARYGLAGVGAISLASTIVAYSDRVDAVVTSTIYPAICAVSDRTDLLYETFIKSNRLSLIWGLPFGVGVSLFAADIVDFVLPANAGWASAEVLLQVFGISAALAHIGFNWGAFYLARGQTRPIAVWSTVTMVSFLLVPLPLLIFSGFTAFAFGIAVMSAVSLAVRTYYLARIFEGYAFVRHAARAMLPTVPAVAVVLGLRLVESGDRTLGLAIAEVGCVRDRGRSGHPPDRATAPR